MKQKTPIFKKSILSLAFCIVITLIYVQKGDKDRNAFQKISGTVISIDNTNERYAGKDIAKFRYIQIDIFLLPFQIFIGKSTGDFKPKYEQIDNLKAGDSVTIYFEETNKTKNDAVNNLAYFIDRGNEVVFIKGNSIKVLLYGLIIFCGLLMVLLIILKKRGKII